MIEKFVRILLIDDDEQLRRFISLILKRAHYDVIEASTGEQGIVAFNTEHPDLILLDVKLPDSNGYEVCVKIRSLPFGSDLPIIMITGLEDIDSVQKSYEVGATDFISKPLNWTLLIHRIPYILQAQNTLQELKKRQFQLMHVQKILKIGTWEWDLNNDYRLWSKELSEVFKMETKSIAINLEQMLKWVYPEDRAKYQKMYQMVQRSKKPYNFDYRIFDQEGRLMYVNERAEIFYDQNQIPISMLGSIQDISEQKQIEETIATLAYFDQLSGLSNRLFFRKILENTLREAIREKEAFAVLFLDLDDFKVVNDTMGHDAGDLLLKEVAARIVACLRHHDYICSPTPRDIGNGSVSRLGGDEFTVVLKHLKHPQNIETIAKRLISAINEEFKIKNKTFNISVSIGIALYPRDGSDADSLLKSADVAMYYSKKLGKNTYHFYDPILYQPNNN